MAKKKPAKAESNQQISFEDMVADLEKKFGDSIQWGGNMSIKPTASTATGLPSLDHILGCRGIPDGRIIEMYGAESSGKTTLALQIVASFQKQNKMVAYIDAEHALDRAWATELGVNVNKWLLSQPDSGNQAFNIVEALVISGKIDLVIVDSVAALVPQEELDCDIGDKQIGAQARMMSKGLRGLIAKCQKTRTTVIFINQLRDKIGQAGPSYIKPETTPGGRALKFYSSVRLEVRRAETLRENNKPYGVVTKIKIAKNKVAPPFQSTQLEIHFGKIRGFAIVKSLILAAIELGVITIRGSNYYFGERKIAIGKDKLESALIDDDDLYQQITAETYKSMDIGKVSNPADIEAKDIKDDDDGDDDSDNGDDDALEFEEV